MLGPGRQSSPIEELAVAGDRLFFTRFSTLSPRLFELQLWRTDGTTEGTVLVRGMRCGIEDR